MCWNSFKAFSILVAVAMVEVCSHIPIKPWWNKTIVLTTKKFWKDR